MKSEVDKLDVDKVVPVPVDLSKPSAVVKNGFVKRTKYDELVKSVDVLPITDTNNLVKKNWL